MKKNIIGNMKVAAFIAAMFCCASTYPQAFSSGGGSATGYKSTLGLNNTANGNYSLAAGWGNQANGQTSFALGYYSKTTGLNSLALGMYASSQADYGITIGRGLSSTKPLSNTTSGIMLGMYSNVPTLYISPSSGENRTGKVGIGNVTDPQAKLHIKGDAIENADIFLASTGSNNSVIRFRNDDNNITVGSNNAMLFNAASMQFNPTSQVVVNGAFKATGNVVLSALASSTPKLLTVGANGQLATTDLTTEGDNLGNHTATQNLNLNGKKIVNGTAGTGGIFVSTAGKVRIGTGTTTPTNALEVNGTTVSTNLKISGLASSTQKVLTVGTGGQVSATDGSTFADNMGDHTATQNINLNGRKIVNGSASTNGLFVGTNGNVRIGAGSGNPSNALEVNGIVRTKEVLVEITGWSDFVFEKDYKLMSLAEVEQFVKQHGHLPDIPSANEVEENGIGLGEMNALLLQKIEEMTLHLIEMEKRIQELESQSDMNNP